MYSNNKLNIKQWAEEDRPREKLLLKSKNSLSDAELIAILIGAGNKEESAVELSKRILAAVGNDLNELAKLSVADLSKFKGIGEAKAISIVAALELGRRKKNTEVQEKPIIQSSQSAFNEIFPFLSDLSHEEFWVTYLNRRNQVIRISNISKGGVAGTVADGKIIFKEAIELLSSAIILNHNHPSGNLTPSAADKTLTKKLVEVGQIMDIPVIDHIIIAGNNYFSFADNGLIS